jgi:hypothetical protein
MICNWVGWLVFLIAFCFPRQAIYLGWRFYRSTTYLLGLLLGLLAWFPLGGFSKPKGQAGKGGGWDMVGGFDIPGSGVGSFPC